MNPSHIVGPLEATVLVSLAFWFAYFILNHATITAKVRNALYPVLPHWLVSLLLCPICVSFWTLTALSLFWGYTPLMWYCPPVVLLIDLCYRRLREAITSPPPSTGTPPLL